MTLPVAREPLFGGLELSNACVHACRHLLICAVPGARHKEQLKLELANLVWSTANNTRSSISALALDARSKAFLLRGPFVETSNLSHVRPTKAPVLMFLEAHIGSSEATILSSQGTEELIP
jgi:hypothetical protein